jgi:acyl carrier protein
VKKSAARARSVNRAFRQPVIVDYSYTSYTFKEIQMENFNIKNLIELIKDVAEQDEAAQVDIGMESLNASFDDLGMDSLTFFSIVAQLETQYGIRIGFAEAMSAKTPAELFELVVGRLETV